MTQPATVTELIDQRPLSGLQWMVLALCAAVVLLDGFDVQAAAFTGPAIAAAWGIERNSLGPVFAAGLAGMAVGALLIGPVGDRYGRRPALLVSVFAFGAFTLLTAWAKDYNQLLALRLLTGFGLGGALPNATALIAEYAPQKRRNLCVAVMFLGIPLGGLLGGVLAAQIVPLWGWQSVFIIGGGAPLCLLPLLWLSLPESLAFLVRQGAAGAATARGLLRRIDPAADLPLLAAPLANTDDRSPIGELFRPGYAADTLKLWAAFFTNLIAVYFLISWVPTLLVEAGFDASQAALGSVALNLGGATGPLLLAAVSARYGTRWALPACLLLAAVSVAMTGQVAHSRALLLTLIFLCGFFIFGAQISLNSLAAYIYPTHARSTGVGWALGIGRIGSILGPVVGGLLLQRALGLPTYFLVFSTLLIAAAGAAFSIRRHQPAV